MWWLAYFQMFMLHQINSKWEGQKSINSYQKEIIEKIEEGKSSK